MTPTGVSAVDDILRDIMIAAPGLNRILPHKGVVNIKDNSCSVIEQLKPRIIGEIEADKSKERAERKDVRRPIRVII